MPRSTSADPAPADSSFPVTMLSPPYRVDGERAFNGTTQMAPLSDGTLFLLALAEAPDPAMLGDAIRSLRRRWPTAPVILRARADDPAALVRT